MQIKVSYVKVKREENSDYRKFWNVIYKKKELIFLCFLVWLGLVGFYGISTIVGYLMPNPVCTYI